METNFIHPISPRETLDGVICFPRLCDKIRLFAAGKLACDYHANLGSGMDLWTCQFLGVDYVALKEVVLSGKTDAEALAWAREHGTPRSSVEQAWWISFMRNRGYRDDLSERLEMRKAESGLQARADIQCFMDYIDADEGRL